LWNTDTSPVTQEDIGTCTFALKEQGALSLGAKRQGREADHSLPASAEVKKNNK
jgi:hypothetical protein